MSFLSLAFASLGAFGCASGPTQSAPPPKYLNGGPVAAAAPADAPPPADSDWNVVHKDPKPAVDTNAKDAAKPATLSPQKAAGGKLPMPR